MRILVTGAAGVIGKNLCEYLCETGHQIIPVALVQRDGVISADLRNEATVFRLVKEYAPNLILHLAAITNLCFCEQNKETARATNYGITEILTRVCSEFGTRMIFFSSDYVFGKYDHFWQEEDPPCPTIQYGIDKAASERLIRERLSNYAIVRTAQLYGFAGDFVSLVCEALISHQEFIAFANLVNCPTWIGDLFPMVNKIITYGSQGIFHCVGPEAMSRYQYACEIANAFALDTSYIQAVNLDFSTDIRPPVVRLNGASTYETLQVYPGRLKDNLPFCSLYAMEVTQQ
ncbi:sugar nucleotide-binding protein [Candidatus Parabeggiatoa sp. HSG14]|uniref:SDR family oxidoreductase n=1 Tax=Candidatus Parabeggiatoa sp. HSG14 TaxID=3055593 RepID=UPI0025A75501|nr:sugar nucleotide-binding protein [Thiotrichales bacterium HSG14]